MSFISSLIGAYVIWLKMGKTRSYWDILDDSKLHNEMHWEGMPYFIALCFIICVITYILHYFGLIEANYV